MYLLGQDSILLLNIPAHLRSAAAVFSSCDWDHSAPLHSSLTAPSPLVTVILLPEALVLCLLCLLFFILH